MRTELKVLRVKNHLTQAEMAEKIGVTRVNYSAIEQGRNNGSLDFWDKLQAAFSIPDAEMYNLIKPEKRVKDA